MEVAWVEGFEGCLVVCEVCRVDSGMVLLIPWFARDSTTFG